MFQVTQFNNVLFNNNNATNSGSDDILVKKDLLDGISKAVISYNGQLAAWKRSGYKGAIPGDLFVTINDLFTSTEKFLMKMDTKVDNDF